MKAHSTRCVLVAGVLALLMVSGCGSGGSGGSAPAPAVVSGQIIDSLVQGLDYRAASSSGLTDASGTFSYSAGEAVSFSIGDLALGSLSGKPIATLLDLVPGARIEEFFYNPDWDGTSDSSGVYGRIKNQRVKNIARFLQSIDSDCNLLNGIQITSQIRAEVSPRVIDFDQSASAFGADPVMADLFSRLNAAGAFAAGCSGALRPERVAESHLVRSIYDTWMLAGGSIDSDGDGTVDDTRQTLRDAHDRVTEYALFGFAKMYNDYDDVNRTVTIRRDDNGDGTIDYVWRTTHDEQRRVVKEEEDYNGDGVYDNETTIERDIFGRETGRFWIAVATGQTYRYTYQYDADGNLVLELTDSGDDGSIDYETRYTYVGGKRTKEERRDGALYSTRLYTYSGDNLTLETTDVHDDGVLDYRTEYAYDANDNLLTIKSYEFRDNGGVFAWFLLQEDTYVYNGDNFFVEQTLVFHDPGGGPDQTHRQVVSRDANNQITRSEWTKPSGMTEIQTYIWEEQTVPSSFDIYIPGGGPLAFS